MSLDDIKNELNEGIDADIDTVFDAQELQMEVSRVRQQCAERIHILRAEYKARLEKLERTQRNIEDADKNVEYLLNGLRDLNYKVARYSQKDVDEIKEESDEERYNSGFADGERFGRESAIHEKLIGENEMKALIERVNRFNNMGDKNPYKTVLLELAAKHGFQFIIAGEW